MPIIPAGNRQMTETGSIWRNSGAPTSGTSGTFAGIAPKGSLLVDFVNAALYVNTGTQASPTWTQVTVP